MKKISIIIPVYQEAQNLERLQRRLDDVTSAIPSYDWEYLYVNDGSTDSSLEILSELAKRNKKCRVVDLSRNFGKEIAMTAGVHEVNDPDAIICIDADLQHPPELIPQLIDKWVDGAEIVVTIRKKIDNWPLFRRLSSYFYYWLMLRISGLKMVPQTTDYRLYDKKVVSAFKLATERERMFRGIMDWMGFRKAYIEFDAEVRGGGTPAYSYSKLIRLAIGSITAFSLWPLKITGYLGIGITVASGGLLAWMLLSKLLGNTSNYTPLAIVVVANTFLIGIVLIAIGLVAIYVGSIHTEVINRPLYIVRDRIN